MAKLLQHGLELVNSYLYRKNLKGKISDQSYILKYIILAIPIKYSQLYPVPQEKVPGK